MKWRFLIVEDDAEMVRQLQEVMPSCVEPPDEVEVFAYDSFTKAKARLEAERFDVLILDLKDESDTTFGAAENPAGLAVFEELKKIRFVPVVFYTALAHKVRSEETSYVRVVEKTEDVTKVRTQVRQVLETGLPWLTRQIEDLQRGYIWDFVGKHWKEGASNPYEQTDLTYLLTRRLALALESEARKMARKLAGTAVPMADPKNIHPMQMYVYPPIGGRRLAGDVVKGTVHGETGYWIVLTPSCDFERESRISSVLLARCVPFDSEPEYLKWRENPEENLGALKEIIGDNRSKAQSERFKFLPGTYFLPDMIADFQRLSSVSLEELKGLEAIVSLDSPFAEALLDRFSRYFGRIGTPDVDKNVVIERLRGSTSGAAPLGKPRPA